MTGDDERTQTLIVFLSRGNGFGVSHVSIPYADAVAFVYFSYNLRGNSRNEAVGGNVSRDNRSRGDNAVFAYRNAAADNRAGAYPTTVFNRNRRGVFEIVSAVGIVCVEAFFDDKRMVRRG